MLLWASGGGGVWRYASLDLFALLYFYRRWSAPEAQHRQFHFLLMCSYLISTAFYAYQIAVSSLVQNALAMSPWWFELFSNVLFEFELLLIITYALLFRQAKANTMKWRLDVNDWFVQIGVARRNVVSFVRHRLWPAGK